MLDRIDRFHNWLSDNDWTWWPLLSWRPSKKEDFTDRLVLKLMMVGAPIGAVAFTLLMLAIDHQPSWAAYWIGLPSGILIAFLWVKFLVASAWNRRAQRLRKGGSRK